MRHYDPAVADSTFPAHTFALPGSKSRHHRNSQQRSKEPADQQNQAKNKNQRKDRQLRVGHE